MVTTTLPIPAPVQVLQQLFEQIAQTRMAGVPILHPGLRVEALGFAPLPPGAYVAEPAPPDQTQAQAQAELLGILITPWFMNLVCLPLQPCLGLPNKQAKRSLCLGEQSFEFLAHSEPGLGAFWSCSLFSPMGEFRDQAQARETAWAVLQALRAPPAPPPTSPQQAHAELAVPSRRALLFGRSAAAALGRP